MNRRALLSALLRISCAGVAILVSPIGLAQQVCDPGAISLAPTYEMIRTGNNSARAYGSSTISGPWTLWYLPRVKLTEKLNGVIIEGPETDAPNITGTTTADVAFTNVIQTAGTGTYRAETDHWANSAYCEYFGYVPIHHLRSDQTTIQRPERPDYCNGCSRALYYLGEHFGFPIAFDGDYVSNASLVPGNSHGATGTPEWVLVGGSSTGELSCTNCSQPVFQAISSSPSCNTYDVLIKTRYDGLESEGFWMFINRPHRTVMADDLVGGTWNYTFAWGNGWESHVNYEVESLCPAHGVMSNFSMNEVFGLWTPPDYPGASWSPPPAGTWTVPGQQWFDLMSFQCPAGNCTPMPLNPGANTEKVQHADQDFRVGKTSVNSGARIQRNVHQRYRDEGRHESIQTPKP